MKNQMTIMGIRRVEFKTKEGDTIKGYSIYLSYQDENVRGLACCKEFLSDAKFNEPFEVGDNVVIRYNRYGKIDCLEIV